MRVYTYIYGYNIYSDRCDARGIVRVSRHPPQGPAASLPCQPKHVRGCFDVCPGSHVYMHKQYVCVCVWTLRYLGCGQKSVEAAGAHSAFDHRVVDWCEEVEHFQATSRSVTVNGIRAGPSFGLHAYSCALIVDAEAYKSADPPGRLKYSSGRHLCMNPARNLGHREGAGPILHP